MKKAIFVSAVVACAALATSAAAGSVVFSCQTPKHLITVTQEDGGSYSYRSWNTPKTVEDTPDAIVLNGTPDKPADGACSANGEAPFAFRFIHGNVEYDVDNNTCRSSSPVPNSIGNLDVYINGNHVSHFTCQPAQGATAPSVIQPTPAAGDQTTAGNTQSTAPSPTPTAKASGKPSALAAVGGVGAAFFFICAFLLIPYMAPTIIAVLRKHKDALAIGAVNIIFGLTGIGWIVAFVWSLTSPNGGNNQTIIVQQGGVHTAPPPPPSAE